MKKAFLTILISLFICSLTHAAEIKWYTWNEGYELAKKENKPMLVFVYAPWCNVCKRLEEKTFNDEQVIPLINEKFIPVKLNPEEKIEYQLGDKKIGTGKILQALTIDASKGLHLPTTVLWYADSKNGKVLAGLMDPTQLKKALSGKLKKR